MTDKHIIVGLSDFPYKKRAADSRLLALISLLKGINGDPILLNRFAIKSRVQENESSKFLYNSESKLRRTLLLLPSLIKEYKYFGRNAIDHTKVFIHVYSGHFIEIIHYYIISKLFNFKLVYHYVEFRSEIHRKGFYHIVNGFLVDNYALKFFDGIICISNFLKAHSEIISPNSVKTIVPPICDFAEVQSLNDKLNVFGKYLLFCGAVGYREILDFIVDVFHKSNLPGNGYSLRMVLNGNQDEISDFISRNKEKVEVLSNIPYSTLYSQYLSAKALFIPIRETVQDKARFPNKIAEYLAASGLIITNDFGEVSYYFKDMENSLVANSFSEDSYIEKLNLIPNLENITDLKIKAHELGLKYFNTVSQIENMSSFIKEVVSEKNQVSD